MRLSGTRSALKSERPARHRDSRLPQASVVRVSTGRLVTYNSLSTFAKAHRGQGLLASQVFDEGTWFANLRMELEVSVALRTFLSFLEPSV